MAEVFDIRAGLCGRKDAHSEDWSAARGSAGYRKAKETCRACPIRQGCAEYALTKGIPFCIWGGLDEQERASIWSAQGGRPTTFADEVNATLAGAFAGHHREDAA